MANVETLNLFDRPEAAKVMALFKLGNYINCFLATVYFIGFFLDFNSAQISIFSGSILLLLILWINKARREVIGNISYKQRRDLIKPYKMRVRWYLLSLIFVVVVPLFIQSIFTLSSRQMLYLIGGVFFLNNSILTIFYLKNPYWFI